MTTNRSPATHLRYNDKVPGDIILIDVLVPKAGAQEDTYYSGLNFSGGSKGGGGYCGIQDHGKGKRVYIFSLWDPHVTTSEKITAVYQGLWTKSHYFGHEGSGLHSDNTGLGWDPGNWYTLAVRCWDAGHHTHYGFWVHNQTGKVWTHIVTMEYPVGGLHLASATSSFMENYTHSGDGSLHRIVHYGHGFKRQLDKTWRPFDHASFSVNQGQATAHWNHNFNAGARGDYFFMETGKNVHPDSGVDIHDNFDLTAKIPAKPTNPNITFHISHADHNSVQWTVPESATPQFRYTVDVDGKHVASGADPEKRSIDLGHAQGHKVTVTLEDLLGGSTSMSHVLT